jgi:hypothetical protein
MDLRLEEIGKRLSCKPSPGRRITVASGYELPEDYVSFIHEFNSAEGSLGSTQYVALWSVEELESLNEGYSTEEFWPGVLFFGSDGGGMGYAFDFREQSSPILTIPFDSIDPEDTQRIADTFTEFMIGLMHESA